MQQANAKEILVKILLQEVEYAQGLALTFETDQEFVVTFSTEPEKKYVARGPLVIHIKNDGEHLYITSENKKTRAAAPAIVITPKSGHLTLNDRRYEGSFCLQAHNNNLYVINRVPLEQYVYSVLKTESWPGWSLEINKTFAIAIRSYVLHKREQARASKLIYDIKDTNHHQTYTGYHDTPILKQAVEETKGWYIAYNKRPILAMFDCCCGGIIPGKIENGINFAQAPYLKRVQQCKHCQDCKIYQWRTIFTISELEDALRPMFPKINGIREIRIVKRDRAGLVTKIHIRDKHTTYVLGGRKLYSLCGNKRVKSHAFSIKKESTIVIIEGKGYGHHLGMCQWGAKHMIEKGHTFKDVIAFYYPGTELLRLPREIDESIVPIVDTGEKTAKSETNQQTIATASVNEQS